MISIILLFISLNWTSTIAKRTEAIPTKHEDVHEILVPLHSHTPLMCEPVFNRDNPISATWYKNGIPIGRVSSSKNLIYKDRPTDMEEEIPQVGFLIISHILLDDQGDYWCQPDGFVQKPVKVYRLQIAYIEPFSENQRPIAHPHIPELGRILTIECPSTKSYPKALISWKVNDESVDFASGRIEVTQNGSLLIRRFSSNDGGVYSCTYSNFAGQTSTQVQLFAPVLFSLQNDIFNYEQVPTGCSPYFRNGLLWFLIGCLSTSCVVLVYLMAGLFCYRYSRRAARFTPLQSIFRADPSLAPGFRKAVAPVQNFIDPRASGNAADV